MPWDENHRSASLKNMPLRIRIRMKMKVRTTGVNMFALRCNILTKGCDEDTGWDNPGTRRDDSQ
jgi:hypothetical protein